MSDDELLEIAKAESEDGVEGPQTKQDLEIIAILSAVNTAVTVCVLGFLYIISLHAQVQLWRSKRCTLLTHGATSSRLLTSSAFWRSPSQPVLCPCQ